MPRIRHIYPLLAALLLACAVPAVAQADYRQAIRDCAADGTLHHRYSQSDIRQALQHLPQDINEYTDCYDVLTRALNAGGGTGGAGSSAPTNPALTSPSGAQAASAQDLGSLNGAIAAAHRTRSPKVSIGGIAAPGAAVPAGPFTLASRTASNALPGPLLAALVALATIVLAAGAIASRRSPWPRRVLRAFRR